MDDLIQKSRLVRECDKLDPEFEQSMAEEGISTELEEWPEYWAETFSGRI